MEPPENVRLRTLERLLAVKPETQTADDADEEGKLLEALAMGLAKGEGKTEMTDKVSVYHDLSTKVFASLIEQRVLHVSYRVPPNAPNAAHPGSVLRVLQCVRLFLRFDKFVAQLLKIESATQALCVKFKTYADLHFSDGHVSMGADQSTAVHGTDASPGPSSSHQSTLFKDEILRECASVFKKITSGDANVCSDSNSENFADASLVAVSLLSSRDPSLLASALVILRETTSYNSCEPDGTALRVTHSDCAFHLLQILREYQAPFDSLAADVLTQLSRGNGGMDGVRAAGGIRTALGLVSQSLELGRDNSSDAASTSEDTQRKTSLALHLLSGILKDRACVVEARGNNAYEVLTRVVQDCIAGLSTSTSSNSLDLKICQKICQACSALVKLAADDDGGEVLANLNAVHWLGRVLVRVHGWGGGGGGGANVDADADANADKHKKTLLVTAQHCFRLLRFIFSCERERVRSSFKLLWNENVFSKFIDVGHYQYDMVAYAEIAQSWVALDSNSIRNAERAFQAVNAETSDASTSYVKSDSTHQNPPRTVGGYSMIKKIGEGAFGTVYKATRNAVVGKQNYHGSFCAIKELNCDDGSRHLDQVKSEVAILKKLTHPNIVSYYESFVHGNAVYIVMELAKGASILERINGLITSNSSFPEDSLNDVFCQVSLALRYIHDDLKIVHRDITPSNILFDVDLRKVQIVDFGLAAALRPGTSDADASKGNANDSNGDEKNNSPKSPVGTMPYSSPEVLKHEQYDGKADVWSFGCVLYHAMALHPPFRNTNPLTMASEIVEGRFVDLSEALSDRDTESANSQTVFPYTPSTQNILPYSKELTETVTSMLTVDKTLRPSVSELLSRRVDLLAKDCDRTRLETNMLRDVVRCERNDFELSLSMERQKREAFAVAVWVGVGVGNGTAATVGTDKTATGGKTNQPLLRRACSVPVKNGIPGIEHGLGSVKIAPGRLRPVSDPALEIIGVLHKLNFVERLPPSAVRDTRRAVVTRFNSFLWSAQKSAGAVKAEAVRLLAGSREIISVSSGGLNEHSKETYADVSTCLEELLLENRFYKLQRAESR